MVLFRANLIAFCALKLLRLFSRNNLSKVQVQKGVVPYKCRRKITATPVMKNKKGFEKANEKMTK